MKSAWNVAWVMLVCGGAYTASAQDFDPTVVTLFDGRELRGVILQENEQEVVVRTWTGDKKLSRQNITGIRRNLTADERDAILRTVNPWKDELAAKEHDKQFAAGPRVDTPKVESVVHARTELIPKVVEIRPNPHLSSSSVPFRAGLINTATWQERISAGLDKKVTMELIDTELEEAMTLISSLTGLNIIISPKVREQKPKVTINVKSMDAASALQWLTRLSDTFIEVHDQALYVTDKPSKEAEDEERNDILMVMAANRVDMSLVPAAGSEITDADRMKIAMAIWEKTNPKPQDFPGPDLGLAGDPQEPGAFGNPFGGN